MIGEAMAAAEADAGTPPAAEGEGGGRGVNGRSDGCDGGDGGRAPGLADYRLNLSSEAGRTSALACMAGPGRVGHATAHAHARADAARVGVPAQAPQADGGGCDGRLRRRKERHWNVRGTVEARCGWGGAIYTTIYTIMEQYLAQLNNIQRNGTIFSTIAQYSTQ